MNYRYPKGIAASEVKTPTNVGSSFRSLSLCSADKCFLSAKFLIFMAALTSRSSKEPQPLQVQERTCRLSSLLIAPQFEQHFDDGSNRPIFKMRFPYQAGPDLLPRKPLVKETFAFDGL
ncbi:MAG TPA: hypothetical protein VK609_03140 [Mucilaginibacter sp.]|nr:hypothetical protein [Mucilaginibacter sp.]